MIIFFFLIIHKCVRNKCLFIVCLLMFYIRKSIINEIFFYSYNVRKTYKITFLFRYNINLLIFKRTKILNNNKILMFFDKVDDIIVNYIIIELITLIKFKIIIFMIKSIKFVFFVNCLNSTLRSNFSINNMSNRSQKYNKKFSSIRIYKKHKC
jgi:hypothetical protein